MPQYLIKWDAGCGESVDEITVKNHEEALNWAYDEWKDEAESNAEYSAEEMTDELREEHDL